MQLEARKKSRANNKNLKAHKIIRDTQIKYVAARKNLRHIKRKTGGMEAILLHARKKRGKKSGGMQKYNLRLENISEGQQQKQEARKKL